MLRKNFFLSLIITSLNTYLKSNKLTLHLRNFVDDGLTKMYRPNREVQRVSPAQQSSSTNETVSHNNHLVNGSARPSIPQMTSDTSEPNRNESFLSSPPSHLRKEVLPNSPLHDDDGSLARSVTKPNEKSPHGVLHVCQRMLATVRRIFGVESAHDKPHKVRVSIDADENLVVRLPRLDASAMDGLKSVQAYVPLIGEPRTVEDFHA